MTPLGFGDWPRVSVETPGPPEDPGAEDHVLFFHAGIALYWWIEAIALYGFPSPASSKCDMAQT